MCSSPLDFRLAVLSVVGVIESVSAALHQHGCDRCAAGGYHGNGQCNSENHTSLFLRKMATLQWQSAVVSAPYGRWVEELSWETKRTEEERQVGREGWAGMKRGYCLGVGEMQWHRGGTKGTPFIREERKDEKQTLRWMETTGLSANRWSWCVCGSFKAHLK